MQKQFLAIQNIFMFNMLSAYKNLTMEFCIFLYSIKNKNKYINKTDNLYFYRTQSFAIFKNYLLLFRSTNS